MFRFTQLSEGLWKVAGPIVHWCKEGQENIYNNLIKRIIKRGKQKIGKNYKVSIFILTLMNWHQWICWLMCQAIHWSCYNYNLIPSVLLASVFLATKTIQMSPSIMYLHCNKYFSSVITKKIILCKDMCRYFLFYCIHIIKGGVVYVK